MDHDLQKHIDTIGAIPAVPSILDVICRTTGMGFAAIARVTQDRWVACEVLDNIDFGLMAGGELKVESTICHEVRRDGGAVVIDHVSEDGDYRGHPTPAMYGFQSYISVPIVLSDGSFFGTLCALDPKPSRVKSPEVVGMFKLFAELIAAHVDARQSVQAAEATVSQERHRAVLREQFIAVLGHDLRNPVASIGAGARMLLRTPLDEKARTIVTVIQGSVVRMGGLIDNVLDFARGRLGDGIVLERDAKEPLSPVVSQVIDELRAVHPDRSILADIRLSSNVDCDRPRIAQLLSNLIANALTHGKSDEPVQVRLSDDDGVVDLSVSNTGEPIPADSMERLFEPFVRGETHSAPQGLGLGLYISSEIAKAHGGTLTATSAPGETRFTLRFPSMHDR